MYDAKCTLRLNFETGNLFCVHLEFVILLLNAVGKHILRWFKHNNI